MVGEPILEAKNVSFSYVDGTQALVNVSLSIPRGKKIAFLGPNGAGKTTLLLHFNGLMKPDRGKIFFNSQEVTYEHRALLQLRRKIGIVFQDPDTQLFSSSVKQEISFGPLNLGLSKDDVLERVQSAMEATGILDLQDKPTHFLSYGQKKRVAIADILAMRPEVMICDEPTAWLDQKHAAQIVRILDEINGNGVTVIISTHDVDLAYSWADYVFVMKAGTLIGEGTPEDVFFDDDLLAEAELEKPWIIVVYEELLARGLVSGSMRPKSKDDLFWCIDQKHGYYANDEAVPLRR